MENGLVKSRNTSFSKAVALDQWFSKGMSLTLREHWVVSCLVVVTEEWVLHACPHRVPDTPQRSVWPQMSGVGRGTNGGSEQGFSNFNVHNVLGTWVEMRVIVYELFQKRQSSASHPLLTLSPQGHWVFTTGGTPGIKWVEARMLLSPPQPKMTQLQRPQG